MIHAGKNTTERLEKIKNNIIEASNTRIASLKKRKDYLFYFGYFLDVLSRLVYPQKLRAAFNKPLAAVYCSAAPLEIIDSFALQPIQLYCGSYTCDVNLSPLLPTFSCSIAKSCVNSLYLKDSVENLCEFTVLPTACYWKMKIFEMAEVKKNNLYFMDIPHIEDSERGMRRWLEEVYGLKKYLQIHTGIKLKKQELINSINKYMIAWREFQRLLTLRRDGLIPAIWGLIIANAFMVDDVERWSKNLKDMLDSYCPETEDSNPKVFLVGSPIFFHNPKILEAIEEAGIYVAGDSLCTSEMLFGSIVYDDSSEYGLLRAISERHQFLCKCPVFARDGRKIINIVDMMKQHNIKGLIYYVLKGCHPFDLENLYFEKIVKESGLHFLKIESDYSHLDRENILARLEAFRGLLT